MTDCIAPGPEVFAVEVSGFTTELTGDGYGALAFQETDNLGDFILRGYLDEHMHMVAHEVALEYLAILLGGQGVKDLTQSGSDVTVQFLLPHLRDEDDMIFTVPLRVRQTVVVL